MSVFVPKQKKSQTTGRARSKKAAVRTSWVQDQRIPRLIGFTLVAIGLFVFVSCLSYLFTWKADQDKSLNHAFEALGEGELVLENWLGRLGAVVGNSLIYWGFGVP